MLGKSTTFLFLILACASISISQTDFDKGRIHYENGDYEKAIEFFSKSIDSQESGIPTRPFLGMSYVRLKRYDLANRLLRQPFKIGAYKYVKRDISYKKMKFLSRPSAIGSEMDTKNLPAGTTKLVVEFNKNGKVTFIYPYETVNEAMTKRIVKALRKIEFEAAEQNGKKITVVRMVSYRLTKI